MLSSGFEYSQAQKKEKKIENKKKISMENLIVTREIARALNSRNR